VTSREIRWKGPKRTKQSAIRSTTFAQDAQVLTFSEWCELNHISERTGRRILARPDGPVVTELSPRRLGITIANNRAWQASRARKVA
jgi:hypothetical protein